MRPCLLCFEILSLQVEKKSIEVLEREVIEQECATLAMCNTHVCC